MLADATRQGRIPVSIITGFLGSGKTTLLNQILANRLDRKVAVIVNEIGEIGIDGDLIVSTESDMIELSNGCICCSINNDLAETVQKVLSWNKDLDSLVVETTGLADPLPVALTFMRDEFRKELRVDAIITIIDAVNYKPDQFGSRAAQNQLRYGDVIIINKSDLVDEERLRRLESMTRATRPKARVVSTTQCKVLLPLILDSELSALEEVHTAAGGYAAARCDHTGHDHTRVERDHGGPQSSNDHLDHLHADSFQTVSFQSKKLFAVDRLQAFLEGLPGNVFRAKGVLAIEGSEYRYIFHLVGERFTLDIDQRARPITNKLVFIGQDIDRERILTDLEKCAC